MIFVREIDEKTSVVFLEAPKNQINLLQVAFELYDGLGTIRTVKGNPGLLCLITTNEQIKDCEQVLEGLRPLVRWRSVESDLNPLT